MGEEATRLENEIHRERAALAESFQALESKMARASNWRYQFAKRPLAGIAIAFVGGIALAKLITNARPNSREMAGEGGAEDGSSRKRHRTADSGVIAGLRSVAISALAQGVRSYIRGYVARAGSNSERRQPAIESKSRTGRATPDT